MGRVMRTMLTMITVMLLCSSEIQTRFFLVEIEDSKEKAVDYDAVEKSGDKHDNSARLLGLTLEKANKLVEKEKIFYKGQRIDFVDEDVITDDEMPSRLEVETDKDGKIVKFY